MPRPRPMQEQIDYAPQRSWTLEQIYAIGYDRGFRAALVTKHFDDDPVQEHDDTIDNRDPVSMPEPSAYEEYGRGVRDGGDAGMLTKWGPPPWSHE